jgi:hypothetical protein
MNVQTLKIGHQFRLHKSGPLLRVAAIDEKREEIDVEWPDGEGGAILIRRFPAPCVALPSRPLAQ